MRALLMAFLMTTVVLAGCASSDEPAGEPVPTGSDSRVPTSPSFEVQDVDALGLPVPRLLCFDLEEFPTKATPTQVAAGARCNFEMTPDDGREGNEVTIAVNPMDPRNVVGGAKDYYPPDAGQCVWDGVYVTHDGGRTVYQDRSFDGSPWRLYDGDVSGFRPNYASTFWCTTDPVAYFNTNGDLYYLLMAYQTDPVTGGKTGEGVGPGALNDWAFNRATQIVAVSSDGGDTFHTFTPVFEGSFPIDFHDKGWIAASHNGVIHVFWLAILAPGNMYFRSTDGGQTFSPVEMEILAAVGQGSGQGSFVDVGTGPEVYALWTVGSGVQLARSFDYGETWEEQRNIFDRNGVSMPTIDARDRRGGWPQLATDRNPESPFADALYVAWQDACQTEEWSPGCQAADGEEQLGGSGIWMRASFDKGITWTNATRVSDAPTGPNQWRIFPSISVSPGGVIDVSWMDARDTRWIDCPESPVHGEARCTGQYQALTQYHTYSLDGGATWSKDFHVRDAGDQGWDTAFCHHQNGDIFIGDYNDIDSSWQAAHPVWPDTREGHCDVYTATIQRPAFADGWDPVKKAEAEAWILDNPL